ncbi:MAG TPA: MBL fold metallo-hydrolase [Solirubrobacteraceae bacterium]|jgi:hypothetical protein|nr:MBL fold metallo-hydrolase [Solirubrobacteraceae bacterium]
MQVEWYGQSAFRLRAGEHTVVIDPFGDMSPLRERGMPFDYPPISIDRADLVLVTHEHLDPNGIEVVPGEPPVLRSTAGRLQSPIGEVLAVASEHDAVAGTERGPNTIFAFTLDGVVPMHYRTPRIGFLDTADAFLEGMADVHPLEEPRFDTGALAAEPAPLAVVPAAP